MMKPLKLFGRITEADGHRFIVMNEKVCRPVEVSNTTQLHLCNNKTALTKGMLIQVWGENKIFDLTIDADAIQEISFKEEN